MSDSEARDSAFKTIGLMDKAWEFKWAIRFIQIILFLDLALVVSSPEHEGLLDWNSGQTPVLENLSFVLITTFAFTVYAAFLTPFLSRLTNDIFHLTRINNFFMRCSGDESTPAYHFVWLSEIREEAFDKEDTFWIDRYDRIHQKAMQHMNEIRTLGNLMFGAIVLALSNVVIGFTYNESSTLSAKLFGNLSAWTFVSVAVFIVFISFFITSYFWNTRTPLWIEDPRLYKKLRNKVRGAYKPSDFNPNG